jgi:outer membrane protein assembly factor BamE (lipoprotein component of BamABCDE complex)
MSTFRSLAAVVTVVSLSACASAGNQVLKTQDADTVSRSIVDGQSTKATVQSTFGDPNDTSFTDGGNEIWKYTYAYATPTPETFIPIVGIFAGGANVDKKTLIVLFDKAGMVTKHTMSTSHEQIKRGS